MHTKTHTLRQSLIVALAITGACAAVRASAATVTYDFTANPANFVVPAPTQGDPFLPYDLSLTNAATGTSSLPALDISVGDTIEGTVTFTAPWTTPAGMADASNTISLQQLNVLNVLPTIYEIAANESFNMLNNGVVVNTAADGYTNDGGSAMGITVSNGTNNPINNTTEPVPAITFNEIQFSYTVDSISALTSTGTSTSITSLQLPTSAPQYQWMGVTSVVPLPPSAVLFGSGLIGLVGVSRKSKVGSA